VLLAVALSLDNLAVGLGLGLLQTPVIVAAIFMGACSLVLTIIGLELGRQLGARVGERSELFSGIVLVAAGLFVLVNSR
jgi:manganese efflux pump family protein